jgi:integrase
VSIADAGTEHKAIKQAEADRAAKLAERKAGTLTEPSKVRLYEFYGEVFKPFLEGSDDLKPNTRTYYENLIEQHLLPRIGGLKMSEINVGVLDRLYKGLKDSGAVKTKSTMRGVNVSCKRLLDHAKRKELFTRNPALDADVPGMEKAKKTAWWTSEELARFVEVSKAPTFGATPRQAHDEALAAMYATTGCRRGEALALRWSDVAGNKLSISKSRTLTASKENEDDPKTESGSREIGLDPDTVKSLDRWRKAQMREAERFGPGYGSEPYIFTDESGQPWRPSKTSTWFLSAVRKAGLPRIRLHDVRHSYASAALADKKDLVVLSRRLGHSNIATTIDLYVKVDQNADQDFADQMGAVLHGTAQQA